MLTGLLGNGLAVGLAILCWLLAKERTHLARWPIVAEIMLTAAILGMLLAGELARSTGLGHLVGSWLIDLSDAVGHVGLVIMACGLAFLIWRLALSVIKSANEKLLIPAFLLPFGLALFHTGILATLDADLQVPAADLAAYVAHALGV
jgi:hypothetical protein